MIKTSPDGSLPQFAVRDRLRAHARAGVPAGQPVPPTPPPPPSSGGAVHPSGVSRSVSEQAVMPVVVVVVVGAYLLTVDDHGRLVAEHGPTGRTRVLFAPERTERSTRKTGDR